MKSIFSRHGIPESVYSDNGTHFSPFRSSKFSRFSREWNFKHVTSSPRYPQSNGFIESMVKIIKTTLIKSEDPYKALLNYRATALSNGYSPAELLMSRKLRTFVPLLSSSLEPVTPNKELLRDKEKRRIEKQAFYYNKGHCARDLEELNSGQMVWIVDLKRKGIILEKDQNPRSYIIKCGSSQIRRNRFHLIPLRGSFDSGDQRKEKDDLKKEKIRVERKN